MEPNEDLPLIVALQEGQAKGLAKIFEKYRQPVYMNIYKMVRNADHASDLTTDTFSTLWSNRDKLDLALPILPYIITISRNKCVDFLKKQSSEKEKKAEYAAHVKRVDEYSLNLFEKEEETRTRQTLLLKVISLITSPRKNIVATMHFIDKKKNREIAAALNINIQVVKNMQTANKKFIKKEIKKRHKH
jgi:RNA polymerase sigma-70 factor (ECF subfamily)